MHETDRNYRNDHPLATPIEDIHGLRREPQDDASNWRVWEFNAPDSFGQLRTLRAAFWNIQTQELLVDPNICGNGGLEMAIKERVGVVMKDYDDFLLLAPAEWARSKFPNNSGWIPLLEEKWKNGKAKIRE